MLVFSRICGFGISFRLCISLRRWFPSVVLRQTPVEFVTQTYFKRKLVLRNNYYLYRLLEFSDLLSNLNIVQTEKRVHHKELPLPSISVPLPRQQYRCLSGACSFYHLTTWWDHWRGFHISRYFYLRFKVIRRVFFIFAWAEDSRELLRMLVVRSVWSLMESLSAMHPSEHHDQAAYPVWCPVFFSFPCNTQRGIRACWFLDCHLQNAALALSRL